MPPKTEGKATEKKKIGAPQKNISKGNKKKRIKKESNAARIYKMLNQVDSNTDISSKAMDVMNRMDSFMNEIFERIPAETSHKDNRKVLTNRDFQNVVRLLFSDELSMQDVSEANRAFIEYTDSK